MLKVQLHVLDGELEIEFKKNQNFYSVIAVLSKSSTQNGRVWSGKTFDDTKIKEIIHSIKECHQNPSIPTKITINDGMIVQIELKENTILNLTINNFNEGTKESQLINRLFEYVNELLKDSSFEITVNKFRF